MLWGYIHNQFGVVSPNIDGERNDQRRAKIGPEGRGRFREFHSVKLARYLPVQASKWEDMWVPLQNILCL